MAQIALQPWSERGYELLVRLNAPELTEHLGGPETAGQVRRRHERYLEDAAPGHMFLVEFEHEAVGSVGYWPRRWDGLDVYETGYGILPEYQGRGFAAAALRLCAARAAREGSGRPWLHAFPSIHHAASNAVCRKAGFELVGERDFEYPPGTLIRVGDWRLALRAPSAG
jgi:RimJ/RimL family protein N-acetyltransferase